MDATHYLTQLQALLPPGRAFTREPDAVLTAVLAALAEEFGRLDARVVQLLEELDPRTTTELLADWERVAGLPNPCIVDTQATAERRDALLARLTNRGGQSRQYFIDVMAALGYVITITETRPTIAGVMQAGDELVVQHEHRHYWWVNAPETTVRDFKAGLGAAGDPLRSWGNEALECAITQLAPAHTVVNFTYS